MGRDDIVGMLLRDAWDHMPADRASGSKRIIDRLKKIGDKHIRSPFAITYGILRSGCCGQQKGYISRFATPTQDYAHIVVDVIEYLASKFPPCHAFWGVLDENGFTALGVAASEGAPRKILHALLKVSSDDDILKSAPDILMDMWCKLDRTRSEYGTPIDLFKVLRDEHLQTESTLSFGMPRMAFGEPQDPAFMQVIEYLVQRFPKGHPFWDVVDGDGCSVLEAAVRDVTHSDIVKALIEVSSVEAILKSLEILATGKVVLFTKRIEMDRHRGRVLCDNIQTRFTHERNQLLWEEWKIRVWSHFGALSDEFALQSVKALLVRFEQCRLSTNILISENRTPPRRRWVVAHQERMISWKAKVEEGKAAMVKVFGERFGFELNAAQAEMFTEEERGKLEELGWNVVE